MDLALTPGLGDNLPITARFILENYIPFDKAALDLGVAVKELGIPSNDGTFSFNVEISAVYALVSESGDTAGALDGARYLGRARLETGPHTFRRTSGAGREAIFLNRAYEAGFRPLFDASEMIIRQEEVRDSLVRHPAGWTEASDG